MTWYVFLYNKVQDKVIESATLADHEPVPDQIFNNLCINGELEGYYLTFNRKDLIHWGHWKKKEGEWHVPAEVPEILKLTRMMLE